MKAYIKQCKQCKKLFQSIDSVHCPDCAQQLEDNFELVRKYIYDNPHANVVDISKDTGVPERDILFFLKEGRLSMDEGSGFLMCENCGRSISTGRYCMRCRSMFEKELSAVLGETTKTQQKQSTGLGKMHIDIKGR